MSAKAKPVPVCVNLTPGQFEVVGRIAKRLRCTQSEYLAAAAMSEIAGWGSGSELIESSLTALSRFVDDGETPDCALFQE